MHLDMAGPPGGVNPFTVDEIQELMGLIPSEQQQQSGAAAGGGPAHHLPLGAHPATASQHHRVSSSFDDMHSPMHVNAVAVSNASSAGLASVLGGGNGHRRAPPTASAALTAHGIKGTCTEIDDGTKNQARSERKRSREKQRRTDVNKQFGELTEVLKRIESEEQQLQQERAAREEAREGGPKPNSSNQASRMILPPFSPTNRVDLIARTIAHLERLSHVTKKQVQELQSLEDQLRTAQKAGEDMAQKLKDAVFSQQQQGGMMMSGMMGAAANGGSIYNPMQMAMGGINPMAMVNGNPGSSNAAANGMMSVQPQKQQMMMMVPMMMPPGGSGANAAAGAPGAPIMPPGGQPFMMMPQAFMPSQQPAPGPSSANAPASSTANAPATSSSGGPAPAPSQQLQNQQSMMMQQAMMMQSMQPMMQQMQMMQQQQPSIQPQQPQAPRQQQSQHPQQQLQQPQMIYPAPPQTSSVMVAPSTAGMAASQQRQQQVPQLAQPQQQQTQQSLSSNVTNSSSTQPQETTKGQQQGAGGGSYAYAA